MEPENTSNPTPTQSTPSPTAERPVVVSSEPFAPTPPTPPVPAAASVPPVKTKRRLPKTAVIAIAAVVLLGGGASAFYFGIFNSPMNVYKQALSNTAKGYDKLIEYNQQQVKEGYDSFTGDGTFEVTSEAFSTDGRIGFKGDGADTQLTFDVGLPGSRVEADIRAFGSDTTNTDYYLKASGLTGLGTMFGSPEADPMLAQLNDTWVVADHTLVNALSGASSMGTNKPLTNQEVLDALVALSGPNKEYLFSTGDKAVLKVVKKHGKETVDGHSTYRFMVAINKNNLKAYLKAEQAALKSSKLNNWLKDNNSEAIVDQMFDGMQQAANDLKDTDTFDLWVDTNQRIIYKVRFADKDNAAQNFIDLGLDYKGGNSYPFFISGQGSDDGGGFKFKLGMALNAATHETDITLDMDFDAADPVSVNTKLKLKTTKEAVKIEKPTGAKPLAQVLSELGMGDILQYLQAPPAYPDDPGTGGGLLTQ